ncbi:hypothetical protein ACHAQD_012180 [Fusarium lateritium]
MALHQDEKKKSGGAGDKQASAMLEIWLNEPKEIVSAIDVWSSERAIAQPRHSTVKATSRSTKKNNGGATRAA